MRLSVAQVSVRLVAALQVAPVVRRARVAVSPVVPVVAVASPAVPVVAVDAQVAQVVVVAHRVLSAVVEDARCADVSPSAPSVRSSSRCRPRHWAASVFPAATAKLSSGCAVVHR